MALLLIARHGETDWNRDRRIMGHRDIPLNRTGREQAEDLAERLAAQVRELDGPPPVLFCSDLRRARQTARIVGRALGLSPRATKTLRERALGRLEGHSVSDLAEVLPDEVAAYRSNRDRDAIPESEPYLAFRQRVLRGVRAIARRADPAIVVCHGGVLRVVLREALGDQRFMIGNAALYRFQVGDKSIERVVVPRT